MNDLIAQLNGCSEIFSPLHRRWPQLIHTAEIVEWDTQHTWRVLCSHGGEAVLRMTGSQFLDPAAGPGHYDNIWRFVLDWCERQLKGFRMTMNNCDCQVPGMWYENRDVRKEVHHSHR